MYQELFKIVNKHISPVKFVDASNALEHKGYLNQPPLCKQMVFEMVRVYRECFPSCLNITSSFCIPEGDERWPHWSHGCELGLILKQLRGVLFQSLLTEDEKLEFKYFRETPTLYLHQVPSNSVVRQNTSPTTSAITKIPRVTYEDIKEALVVYKRLNGSSPMPHAYKIDIHDEQYPIAIRGRIFGDMVKDIWRGRTYKDQRAELIALDLFPIQAAPRMKRKYTDDDTDVLSINHTNTNPITMPPRLTTLTSSSYHHQSLGDRKKNKKRSPRMEYPIVKECLLAFQSIHHHLQVPTQFLISSEDIGYPEEIRGRDFGALVRNIRYGVTHRKHRNEFMAMGLEFPTLGKAGHVLSTTAAKAVPSNTGNSAEDSLSSSVVEEEDNLVEGNVEETVEEEDEEEDGTLEGEVEGEDLINLFTTKREISIA